MVSPSEWMLLKEQDEARGTAQWQRTFLAYASPEFYSQHCRKERKKMRKEGGREGEKEGRRKGQDGNSMFIVTIMD